jgi:hypothetical protein
MQPEAARCRVFIVAGGVGAMMVPGIIIRATLTLASVAWGLGLSTTHHVVPCGRSAHSDLVR